MSDFKLSADPHAQVDAEMEAEQYAEYNDMTDTEVLRHTRQIKLKVVDTLINGGISTDPKDVNSLMKVIDSIDRTAQGNIRNAIDQDNSNNTAAAIDIIAAMQRQVGNVDPFMLTVPTTQEPREVVIEKQLVDHDFVEGELSHELKDLQYDSFVDKFESK